ncbi:MAG TPA: peptidylprolyl isomerase [Devosia sp.]|jgi:peptidyl-prolyl cis-trans isomerase C|nr:peptidylprolyl isomerase [Devosia sp.]
MTASVNGIAVAPDEGEPLELAAVRELLRQRAVVDGLLDPDEADAALVAEAVEELLSREVSTPEPIEDEMRRYYDSHAAEFRSGDLVNVRHILFQVTAAVNVPQIRARAEETLNILLKQPEQFGDLARELSNCPSGENGGILGQLGRGDTVPEFEKVLFSPGRTGVSRDLVKTRFGFHIIAVDQRIPGKVLPFELVRDQIATRLKAVVEARALRQYVNVLAGGAVLEGVDLGATATPLVQ